MKAWFCRFKYLPERIARKRGVSIVVCIDEFQQMFADGVEATLSQVAPLFVEQTSGLTTYQLNFIRAVCQGYHRDFGKKEILAKFNIGTRSNIPKLQSALIEREIIDMDENSGYFISDPLFRVWFMREMM